MTLRSFAYWFVCSLAAAIASAAGEPESVDQLPFSLPTSADGSILAVPEPGRAILLFAGIMAMAFTYRRAWLSWKRGA